VEEVIKKKKDQRWGVMIAALYSGFALFIIVLVFIAANQHYDLVESDYYKKGLEYQGRIDKATRARALSTGVTAVLSEKGDSLLVTFPPECAIDSIDGTLLFYRPSNAGWDRTVPINVRTDGTQAIPASSFVGGLWRVKADWNWQGLGYYYEFDVFIPSES
jgi:hypothetical protein